MDVSEHRPLLSLLAVVAAAASIVAVTLARAEAGPEQASQQDAGPGAQAEAGDAGVDADQGDTGPDQGDAAPAQGDAAPDQDAGPTLPPDQAWIFVDKSDRRLVANDGQGWQETFRVALGQNPVGDKRRSGDGRTPEGEFYVCRRIVNNRFHRFLGVSYPGPEDAERGRLEQLIQLLEYRAILRAFRQRTMPPWQTELGGNIGIHGYGLRRDRAADHAAGRDWTDGCIALSNEEVERVYNHTRLGTRLVIVP